MDRDSAARSELESLPSSRWKLWGLNKVSSVYGRSWTLKVMSRPLCFAESLAWLPELRQRYQRDNEIDEIERSELCVTILTSEEAYSRDEIEHIQEAKCSP